MIKGKPFVKWAGGKRQIIDKLLQYVPDEFNTYYEPFVGGGALLFELSPKKAVINDSNKELMNVYNVLCDEDKFKKMCSVLNNYETKTFLHIKLFPFLVHSNQSSILYNFHIQDKFLRRYHFVLLIVLLRMIEIL